MQFQREILDAIRRILRAIRETSRAAELAVGLSGAQLLVLQLLRSAEFLSINEIADRTQTHQSSVSVVVSRLAKVGLVERRPSSQDARRSEVLLTQAGVRLLKRNAPELAQEKLFSAIAQLSALKQKQLAKLLTEIVELAGFAGHPATLFLEDQHQDEGEETL